MRFSLDNNCLIAVEKGEPAAGSIGHLVDAHRRGDASVAVLAISASERQRGGGYMQNAEEFRAHLAGIGMDELEVATPVGFYDVTFFDWCRFPGPGEDERMRRIHVAMFSTPYDWHEFAASEGVDVGSDEGPGYKLWRNRHCDVQGLNSHIQAGRDVFVTSDRHFLDNADALVALGAGRIMRPEDAAALVS